MPGSPSCEAAQQLTEKVAAERWLGRIAAGASPSEVRKSGAGPEKAGTHVGDTSREAARSSKPEGLTRQGSTTAKYILMPSRLVRCREGQTADDAVLTRLFLQNKPGAVLTKTITSTRDWRGAQLTNRRSRTFITKPIARKTNNVAEPP